MAYEEFDFSQYQSSTNNILKSMFSEVNTKLGSLLSTSKGISAYNSNINNYIGDIPELTFESIGSALDLIDDIIFTPIPTRDLLPETVEPEFTHTFLSNNLDTIENGIISYVTSAGSEDFKHLNAAAIIQRIFKTRKTKTWN